MTDYGFQWEKPSSESTTHIHFDASLLEVGDQLQSPELKYINPGSVGFPRDGNGCASYALD